MGKPVLQPLRNQSVVRQPNAFKSESPKISKPRFTYQVDVGKDLSKPVTQHYLPKGKESVFAKPNHMIASSSSRNSSKNMPKFSSNNMVYNHYLDEARKKTQERDRNSKTSVMPSARFQSTANGSKPKPRSTNHSTRSLLVSKSSCVMITVVPIADHSKNSNSFSDSKHFICFTCHKCVFNANHDACITKILKEVNSCAKIQSNKTRNSNKPIEQKSHTQKPVRQIFTGHRFSPNKTSAVYEKTSPRSDLSKADSESTHGSNVDISKIHECKQTLDLSAADMIVMKSMIELESLFGPLFDEYFNGENQVVSKSSAVTTADASDKHQQQPDSTLSTSTLETTVTADGNFNFDDGNPSRFNLKQLCGRLVLTEPEVIGTKSQRMTKPYSSISVGYYQHSNAGSVSAWKIVVTHCRIHLFVADSRSKGLCICRVQEGLKGYWKGNFTQMQVPNERFSLLVYTHNGNALLVDELGQRAWRNFKKLEKAAIMRIDKATIMD
ncbi:hypothetical protein Tco_0228475 [Tanacetum coccineum]